MLVFEEGGLEMVGPVVAVARIRRYGRVLNSVFSSVSLRLCVGRALVRPVLVGLAEA